MKEVVILDRSSRVGKDISALLHTLSDDRSITFLSEDEPEQQEDQIMAQMIDKGMESGAGDSNTMFRLSDLSNEYTTNLSFYPSA